MSTDIENLFTLFRSYTTFSLMFSVTLKPLRKLFSLCHLKS